MELEVRVSGTREEIGAAFRDIGQALLGARPQEEAVAGWTPALATRLWDELRPEKTRRALLLIAQSPEGLDNRVVMRELGITDPQRLKGVFSPIGFAMKRLGMTTKPYTSQRGRFTMSKDVADAIRAAAKGEAT